MLPKHTNIYIYIYNKCPHHFPHKFSWKSILDNVKLLYDPIVDNVNKTHFLECTEKKKRITNEEKAKGIALAPQRRKLKKKKKKKKTMWD